VDIDCFSASGIRVPIGIVSIDFADSIDGVDWLSGADGLGGGDVCAETNPIGIKNQMNFAIDGARDVIESPTFFSGRNSKPAKLAAAST
jgi:hypothetical protein